MKKFLLLLVGLTLGFTSCEKEDDVADVPAPAVLTVLEKFDGVYGVDLTDESDGWNDTFRYSLDIDGDTKAVNGYLAWHTIFGDPVYFCYDFDTQFTLVSDTASKAVLSDGVNQLILKPGVNGTLDFAYTTLYGFMERTTINECVYGKNYKPTKDFFLRKKTNAVTGKRVPETSCDLPSLEEAADGVVAYAKRNGLSNASLQSKSWFTNAREWNQTTGSLCSRPITVELTVTTEIVYGESLCGENPINCKYTNDAQYKVYYRSLKLINGPVSIDIVMEDYGLSSMITVQQ